MPWVVSLGLTRHRFIAAERPPSLKEIAPWEGIGNFHRESICRGGIPNHTFWELLMANVNAKYLRENVAGMIERYPHMKDYWEDKKPKLQNMLASYSTGLHTEGSASKDKWYD